MPSLCMSVCPITTSGATTFSKLGVQFLGLRYYCPSPEKGIPSLAQSVAPIRLPPNTHRHTQPFNGRWSGTTRVGQYQKKHSPSHTHPGNQTSFLNFLHLQRSMASSVFSLRAWQSSRTTCLQVLFGLPLGLGPSTSYSMHFFTQSSSSFPPPKNIT